MEIYVYDGNFNCVGIVDNYASLIWASRYRDNGDSEIYVAATEANLNLLQIGRYIARRVSDVYKLSRNPPDMICKITKVELTTSADSGDYMTVTGIDVKSLLDQRVIWSTTTAQGNAESFVRQLVSDALISPTVNGRQALRPDQTALLALATAQGFTEESTEQVSYMNLGEKIREICARYGWGYRFRRSTTGFLFDLYKGTDRSETVVFSDDFDNLISSDYIIDATEITNVALVGGSGEGASRYLEPAGTATGTARYEIFVDAKNVSNEIKYEELLEAYPLAERNITSEFTFADGRGVKYTDGTTGSNSNHSYSTDWVNIEGGFTTVELTMLYNRSSNTFGVAFYSSASFSGFISGIRERYGASENTVETRTLTIPANAKYMRTSWVPSGNEHYGEFSCVLKGGGYGSIVYDHDQYYYKMSRFDAQIYDADELARLQAKYPGGLVVESVSGDRYYRLTNVYIAELPSGSPAANDSVTLLYIAYAPCLVSLGYDAIAGSGVKETFDGEIDPTGGFKYFEDFFLGDLVLIRNKYGIRAVARIVEIDEVHDASGYRVMPKYEYIN